MIRLSYVSPKFGERSVMFDKGVIRFGRGPDCDICFEGSPDRRVALHHGEFVLEDGTYFAVERDGRHGLWLNGKSARRFPVRSGHRIRLGSPEGPEIRIAQVGSSVGPPDVDEETVHVDPRVLKQLHSAANPTQLRRALPTVPRSSPPASPGKPPPRVAARPNPATPGPLQSLVRKLKRLGKPHEDVQHWLSQTQRELSRARGGTQEGRSGHTMVIMARALLGFRQTVEKRTRRWKLGLWGVLMVSLAVVLGLSSVIWFQHKRLTQLVSEKVAIDAQIQAVFDAMVTETDEDRLAQLEARLELLMGNASEKLMQVRRANVERAQKLAQPSDELELEIRKILRNFNAETYAIPPIFREALQRQIEDLRNNPALPTAFARKRRYWPQIQRALQRKQLPEELGYIAYTESRFDPTAVNAKSGATGMWQLMEEAARPCGISVHPPNDERLDAARSSNAAACYLSKLLIEFGEESFMLALASYNRGENGVRRALHKLAKQPGGFRQRDFWHLYRLKLLPEETREYVPKVLAAAIVLGNPEKYGVAQAN